MNQRLVEALARVYRQWRESDLRGSESLRHLLERELAGGGLRIARFPKGRRLICDLGVPYDRSVYMGHEEAPELELVARLLGRGDVFVDCGANIGLFTVLAADLVGPGGRVFACEPVADTFTRLAENCALNNAEARVRLLNNALGAEPGVEVVLTGAKHNVMHVDSRARVAGQGVTTVTIDGILASSPTVTGFKIDVEGYELEVLRGAEETIRRFSPWMLVEFNSELAGTRELRKWDVHAFLTERDYRAHRPHLLLAGDAAPLADSWINPRRYANLLYCRGELPGVVRRSSAALTRIVPKALRRRS